MARKKQLNLPQNLKAENTRLNKRLLFLPNTLLFPCPSDGLVIPRHGKSSDELGSLKI